jgi:hypothetical protein
MQPYQEAAQAVKKQGEFPLKIAKAIGAGGIAAASSYLGGGAINRVLPFLSEYIPENLVKKGLSKIDPRYGKFIDKALAAGKSMEEIQDFIGGKIQESQAKQEPAKENRNIIEQYSPELHQFVSQEIKKGRPLMQAGAIAQSKFGDVIKKLTKDHKTQWSDILQSVYGSMQGQAQPQEQQQNAQQQNGPGAQALLNILSKINQNMGPK